MAISTIHMSMPHQVVKGIISSEYAVVKTEMSLVTVIIMRKYGVVIDDSPATKHKTSSGKSGKRNIIESKR